MNNSDPLANLRDIHLPGDVSWWPLAPGWWAIIIVILALSLWALYQWQKRKKHQQILVEVRQELAHIQNQYHEHQSEQTLVLNYSELLRRLLMLHQGREETANLSGKDWFELLSQYLPEQTLSDELVTLMTEGKYQRQIELNDPKPLIQWVESCAEAIGQQIVRERLNA